MAEKSVLMRPEERASTCYATDYKLPKSVCQKIDIFCGISIKIKLLDHKIVLKKYRN